MLSPPKNIREQDPLKQGLKLNMSKLLRLTWECSQIREQDPLKQGLKLFNSDSLNSPGI